MIHVAKEEDLKTLSRRGFLRMFMTAAPAAIIAPKKTFVFFGDILRRPAVQAMPAIPLDLLSNPLLYVIGAVPIMALLGPGGLRAKI